MGLFDFFKRKPKRSPGGSLLIHSKSKPLTDMTGIPNEGDFEHMQERENIYADFFGECDGVNHALLPVVPHIDVYIYPPKDRPFYTLVSGGMSDLPMMIPEDCPRSHARREIIMYVNEPNDHLVGLIRHFALFPFQASTWLGGGHTVPNGIPAEPLFEDSDLVGTLFIPTIVRPDNSLSERFSIDGDSVDFLWLVPITQAELDYKLEFGMDALLTKFDEAKKSVVHDPHRGSCV